MKALLSYIFRHEYYKKVVLAYTTANSKCGHALDIWCEYKSIHKRNSFDTKILVFKDLELIGKINHWIEITNKFKTSNPKTLEWFFTEKHYSMVPSLHFSEYKLIADNEGHINQLHCYLNSFNQLLKTDKESVQRFLKPLGKDYNFGEIYKIVQAKELIIKNGKILRNAHDCQIKYPRAWQSFANKRDFSTIALSELEEIKSEYFAQKDLFIKYYEQSRNQVLLILGDNKYCVDSFTEESYKIEKVVIDYYSKSSEPQSKQIVSDLRVKDPTELKRMILGSEKYGDEVNFVDSFTIENYYKLRESIDKLGVTFDTAIAKVTENQEVVKDFNESQAGKRVVHIEDYVNSVTKGSDLYKYIEHFKEEQNVRNQAGWIHSRYSRGCDALFGNLNLQTCDIKLINSIIDSKEKIVERDKSECEKERYRLELERENREQKRKKQEVDQLRSCVSDWSCLLGGLHYNYLLNYYPTTCSFAATEEEWADRYTVWNFKNIPGKTSAYRHEVTLDNVIPEIKAILTQSFGLSNLHKLTLVCIPASKQENTVARYQEFAERLCEETGMENAFSMISVVHDKVERRSGGTSIKTDYLSFDSSFFKDKYILLFDDVITRGDSMRTFKSKLESLGAYVVAGFSIGKTKHER